MDHFDVAKHYYYQSPEDVNCQVLQPLLTYPLTAGTLLHAAQCLCLAHNRIKGTMSVAQ